MTALLVFLLLHPHRAFSRSYVAGTFWPDAEEAAARQGLRVALVALRKLLEERPEQKDSLLVTSRSEIQLHSGPRLWVDVWELRRRLDESRRLPRGSGEWFEALERVVALYRGPLVPDIDNDWCLPLRDELRQQALAVLQELTRAEEERRQHRRAIDWARRALEVDGCAEESHRDLIRLHSLLGERASAIHQYHECRRILREELGAAPDEATQRLFRRLHPGERRPEEQSRQTPAPPLPDLWAPLVGREQEQAQLREAWERVRLGRGECVLLAGEAGIGKSRLGAELLHETASHGALALYGQAWASEAQFLYQPLLDPTRRALHIAEEQHLSLCDKVWLGHVARLLPELRGEAPGPGGREAGGAGSSDTASILEGLTRFFITLSLQRPLCLVIDDLHWSDPATGGFLRYFARRLRSSRVLLVGSYRTGEVVEGSWLAAWLREEGMATGGAEPGARRHSDAPSSTRRLALSRLDAAEVVQLLVHLAEGGASEALLGPLGARLYAETEGNPFFLLEQVRVLFEEGWLELTDERRWRVASERLAELGLAKGPLTSQLPLSPTVRGAVQQRVALLQEQDQQLLACAAIIGRHFTFETLRLAIGWEMDAALGSVERLLGASFIRTRAEGFDFQHDQIREAVLEGLSAIRRQNLHRRVGEAMETIVRLDESALFAPPPDAYVYHFRPTVTPTWTRAGEIAPELAYHFSEAATLVGPEKAARYHLLAGSRARTLCAYDRAIGHLETACDLLERLPHVETPLALWEQLAAQLAPVCRALDRADAAWAALQAHLRRCEAQGDPRWIARACALLGSFVFLNPPYGGAATACEWYERAVALCRRHGLEDWIVWPQSHLAHVLVFHLRETERGAAVAREAWERADESARESVGQRLTTALMFAAALQGDLVAWMEAFRQSLAWGGPWSVSLVGMLMEIERQCIAMNRVEAFYDLCREAKRAVAAAGLKPEIEHWYLEPVDPPATPSVWQIEERFTSGAWQRRLRWVDPTARSRAEHLSGAGGLQISPAPGANMWPEADLNAPRLLANAPGGDWVAQTLVELEPGVLASFGGLLLWQDALHFVRLELQQRRTDQYMIEFAAYLDGEWIIVGRGCWSDEPAWLRLERSGESLRALCSADGERWLTSGSLTLPPTVGGPTANGEQVGLVAISERVPTFARFEGFWLASSQAE
jgi:DNA-binding SARP family transcriptional activator